MQLRESSAYRWVDYHKFSVEEEKDHIRKAITSLKNLAGYAPRGWYYGRDSAHSRALVPEVYKEMGEELLWYSDTYADDVPYWIDLPSERDSSDPKGTGLLMVPYTFDCNDFKFYTAAGSFSDPKGFLTQLKNSFDVLYEEGVEGMPKMMTIGLHCRISKSPFDCLKPDKYWPLLLTCNFP
jgi:peptidoglycan/xylan/chitin deacetylase (PgdA/CDA1 family)